MTKAVPRPTGTLNIALAKQSAMDIPADLLWQLPYQQSDPILKFPIFSAVSPISAGSNSRSAPSDASQLSSSPEVVDIQDKIITNAMSSTGICSVFGGLFFYYKVKNYKRGAGQDQYQLAREVGVWKGEIKGMIKWHELVASI